MRGVSAADLAALHNLDPAKTERLASTIAADLARLKPAPQLFGNPGALASIAPVSAVAPPPPLAATQPESSRSVAPKIEPDARTQSAAPQRRSPAIQSKKPEFASINPALPHPVPHEAPLAERTEAQNQPRGWVGAVLGPSAGGVAIYDVYDAGPAAHAGIRRGDVIVEYAGMPVNNPHELAALIAKTEIGAGVKVNLLRQGKQVSTVLTVVDWSEGRDSMRQSATRGDVFAQVELGNAYYRGWGGQRDFDEAISWFRRAAEQGNAEAQFSLGFAYASGTGVAQDNAQALTWYRKAAAHGFAAAQYRLGVMYEKGAGVEQDYHEALSFFRQAAAHDSVDAQVALGVMYYNGEGVERDYAEAVSWFRKAAQQGDASAQYDLGVMYANGRGVPRDDDQALAWYRKAAAQGQERARKAIERIAHNGGGK